MTRIVWLAIGSVGSLLATSCWGQAGRAQLLIVTPREWVAELQEYVAQREDLSNGSVVAWEDIIAVRTGADEPEKIKTHLYEQWAEGKLDHVLLVGDASRMPVRYMVLDRVTVAAFDYAFYASDLYYADLAKQDGSFEDWNAATDGFHAEYFGEVRGEKNKSDPINFDRIDYRPEIGIGRWPVRDIGELRTVVAKSLQFQRGQLASAKESQLAGFIAVDGWVDSRPTWDRSILSLIGWRIEKLYYSDSKRNDGTQPPTGPAVTDLFGRADLLFHAGHGHPDHWHGCVHLRSLLAVETDDHWPIVLSAGCSTAVFAPQAPYEAYVDNRGAAHPGTNAGEQFDCPPAMAASLQPPELVGRSMGTELVVSTPRGAVAYFGCATGSQPCALELLNGFATAVGAAREKQIRLGDAYRQMIEYYYDAEKLGGLQPNESWYPPSVFFQGMKFVLFGDPSLTVSAK